MKEMELEWKPFMMEYVMPATFGCIVTIVNIFLVLMFTKKRHMTKTTFIFLGSLASSDIAFGFNLVVRGFLAPFFIKPEFFILCQLSNGIVVLTGTMSACCILLLLIQVQTNISCLLSPASLRAIPFEIPRGGVDWCTKL